MLTRPQQTRPVEWQILHQRHPCEEARREQQRNLLAGTRTEIAAPAFVPTSGSRRRGTAPAARAPSPRAPSPSLPSPAVAPAPTTLTPAAAAAAAPAAVGLAPTTLRRKPLQAHGVLELDDGAVIVGEELSAATLAPARASPATAPAPGTAPGTATCWSYV